MKKKYVGLSYESDDSSWRLEPVLDEYDLIFRDDVSLTANVAQLISLRDLITDVLREVGAEEPVQISNMGTSFVPTVVAKMDPRFHPDPDGVMGW